MPEASERRVARFTSSFGMYLAGGLAQQAVGFLLLPVYISHLSPSEYGTLDLLTTTASIMLTLLTVGLSSAIVKCYHQDCDTDAKRQRVMPTALILVVPLLVVGSAALAAGSESVAWLLLRDAGKAPLVTLTAVSVSLTGAAGVVLALFRTREEAAMLTAIGFGSFLVLLGLNVTFVYGLGWGVAGILYGNILSTAFTLVAAAPFLRGRARFALQPDIVRPLLTFGIFVVPASIAGWVMNMSDRYVLGYYGQLASVGVYSLGYKFGSVMEAAIVAPFQVAWGPFAFRISKQHDHRRTYAAALTYLLLVSTFVMLSLTHLSYPLLYLIGQPEYFPALRVIPIVALAYLFHGVHYCVSPGVHIANRSKFIPLLVVGSAVLNSALNFLWIPRYGLMGAAWSTAVAFATLAATTFALSIASYPVRYEFARLAKITAAGVVAYTLGRLAHGGSMSVMVPVAVGAVLSFPLTLLVLGFVEPGEKAALGAWLARWLPRRTRAAELAASLDRR